MSPSMKKIAGPLLILVLATGVYYMYIQDKDSEEVVNGEQLINQDIILNTQVFIERREILDKVVLDTEIFSDPVFRSYKTFSKPVLEDLTGRPNPFEKVIGQSNTQSF